MSVRSAVAVVASAIEVSSWIAFLRMRGTGPPGPAQNRVAAILSRRSGPVHRRAPRPSPPPASLIPARRLLTMLIPQLHGRSMITGYNTDVRHNDVVFHVQTEDKGRGNPCVESLVYVGGQVLATKRSGYADLLREGKGEKDIVALMDYQHRLMIAAIRSGKLDDKLPGQEARPGAAPGA